LPHNINVSVFHEGAGAQGVAHINRITAVEKSGVMEPEVMPNLVGDDVINEDGLLGHVFDKSPSAADGRRGLCVS
jgi:hypothetical protein